MDANEFLKLHPSPLIAILMDLNNGTCWCSFGIGDPRLKSHTTACQNVQKFINDFTNRPVEQPPDKTVNP